MPSKTVVDRCALAAAFILALLAAGASGYVGQKKDTLASVGTTVRVGSGHGTVSPPDLRPFP